MKRQVTIAVVLLAGVAVSEPALAQRGGRIGGGIGRPGSGIGFRGGVGRGGVVGGGALRTAPGIGGPRAPVRAAVGAAVPGGPTGPARAAVRIATPGISAGGPIRNVVPGAPAAAAVGRAGNFLALPGQPVARTVNRVSAGNVNLGQIGRINSNVGASFRNFSAGPGVGPYRDFGYGYATPYWNNWASGVRSAWNPYGYHGAFSPRFWATNYLHYPWRRSYYWWGQRPWTYWWGVPTWAAVTSWFPSYGWSQPYYYGYGPGGNVVYSGGNVYMNDQPIATADEYAGSAAALAEVPTPARPDEATDWLALGTFALSEGADDKDPSRIVQLAVDKEGIVSGTMTNQKTKQTYPIQGRVDKETQRVAFTIGDAKDVIFETGIYNLTQQQTPVLVHGDGREETYLLLRLEPPKESGDRTTPQGAAPTRAPPPPPRPLLP